MTLLASLGHGGMAPGVQQWEDVGVLGRTGSVEWWLLSRRSWEGVSNLCEEFSLANTAVMACFISKNCWSYSYLTQVQGADQTPAEANPLIIDFT